MAFVKEVGQKSSNFYRNTKKTLNSQGNPEKKEQSWRFHTHCFQIILQSNNNQNSMALAEKQTQIRSTFQFKFQGL